MLEQVLLCLVVGIADGDTLSARCGEAGGYQQIRVRVAAIDAPERAQPWGNRARQALAQLCHQQPARITQRDTDRWGRLVADVQCQGQDVAAHMVGHGWAWVFDRYAREHRHLYPEQSRAQQARSGLWADLDTAAPPVAPWLWRSQRRARSQ